ncbi:MAG: 3-hydroxyacyl-CoA dehydrogenase NAD-binding domain-containing protein [Flavobacteriales bacterium]|jgi:3-hydroxybutyryl-CoA dehydrogenase|nr:3-hydroxyacyl-CoA dehydrogenase NAD-binding domain-containing protein [Flavobacteriales bacterium]
MDSSMKIAVIGAGTMGSGIAQVAAQAGHNVVLFDTRREAVDKALAGLRKTLDKLVEKGKLTTEQADGIHGRITPASDLKELAGSGLVIEAIIEDLVIKQKLFAELEGIVATDAILATNTSSLSVTAIAGKLKHPERMVGLHFFNPAPLLPLVEVVPGLATDAALTTRMMALMQAWGKVPVVCKDTPGFIVNRVARPFYGEAIRIYEEGIADMPTIDAAMKSVGFKMGPFELMDLIGNDINFTVTKTVWEAFFYDPRYKPSFTQQRQVESGRLGRKSGRGYYQYDASGAIVPQTSAGSLAEDPAGHAQAAGSLRTSGDPAEVSNVIIERILAMLINEAADALFWQVASAKDIDLAMTKGVNYPKGLLAWAEEKGAAHWLRVLERLQATYGEDRYRPSPLLRRMAAH